MEREARAKAEKEAEAAQARCAERERREAARGRRFGGRPPVIPDPVQAKPRPQDQKNFTDPESRLMVDGGTGAFVQAYNAHAAVDAAAQIIIAASVTQAANDKQAFLPLVHEIREHLGELPRQISADSGFFSEQNLTDPDFATVACYVPPERSVQKLSLAQTMRERLATETGRAIYRRRKAIVEPVFGQIKEGRGFRRFSFRGLIPVSQEWQLMCLTHNLLKLFRAGVEPITV